MQCYKCRKPLPASAKICPSCGQPVYTTASSPGPKQGRRLDGCMSEAPSPKDFTAVPNVSSLPPRVDLRPACSPVENQGQLGSCVANAIIGAVEFKRRKNGGDQTDLSRLFVYYNARRMDGREQQDCGTTISRGMAAFLAYGAPPEGLWPYDPERFSTSPDETLYDKAAANAAAEYARVDGIEGVKGALAREQPVVFSISLPSRCYEEAAQSGVVPDPTDAELSEVRTLNGRHAMLLVGYDLDQNILHVRNSWGTEWGDRGYCRLSIDTFQRAMAANTTWVLGSLEASGAFAVTRPAAATSKPVEGGVRDLGAKLRDEIRGSVSKDINDALKGIRDRVTPPRRDG